MAVRFTRDAAERIKRTVLEVERGATKLPGIVRGRTRRRLDDGDGGGTDIYLAVILSGGPGQDYKADIYSDYEKGTKLEENADLKIIQIDAAETVPAGTIYPCFEFIWNDTAYWTAYAPVIR